MMLAATSNKKNTIKLISTNNNIKIPVYDRQGKQINGSTVESGANVTVISKPIIFLFIIFFYYKANRREILFKIQKKLFL